MSKEIVTTGDLHPQDWLIIVESLVRFAGDPNQIETSRQRRAWEIVDAVLWEQDLEAGEYIEQIDSGWPTCDSVSRSYNGW